MHCTVNSADDSRVDILRLMGGRPLWLAAAGVLALGIIVLAAVMVVTDGGAPSAEAAVLDRVRANAEGTGKILATQPWGEGKLVLAGYQRGQERRLAIAFADRRGNGWMVAVYTEETVKLTDVGVGSLLVASFEGGKGQPPWSVAAGELADQRIARVEVKWASGQTSTAVRRGNAYLAVQEGTTTPLEARYLAKDGTEIAPVPVESSP
jgi:hypothetical protein